MTVHDDHIIDSASVKCLVFYSITKDTASNRVDWALEQLITIAHNSATNHHQSGLSIYLHTYIFLHSLYRKTEILII